MGLAVAWPATLLAEMIERRFEIGAGVAVETLKVAARQGEVEILISVGAPTEVLTNSISGQYKVQDALDRMLEGTSLMAVPVSNGKAFGILKRATERGNDPVRSETNSRKQKQNAKTVNTTSNDKATNGSRLLGGLVSIVLASGNTLLSQGTGEKDIHELSPFTVTASNDEGYTASETLAGTRLKTNLRDLGASITLVTGALMNDLGAQDLQEVLPYIANVEVGGGMFGTFAAEGAVNSFGQGTATTLARQRPQSTSRVRGLAAADLTRNYSISKLPVDGYIVDRVAIQRGANAMLFGLGSPAGLINSQLIQAGFADTNEIEFRTDNYGTVRASLDVNRVLADKKFAVRVAALYEDQEFVQEPTFERDRRIFGTFTYKPFKNTTIRVNAESGKITSSRPDYVGPINGLSEQWFSAGMPLATRQNYNTAASPPFPLGDGRVGGVTNGPMNVWENSTVMRPNGQFNGLGLIRRRDPNSILNKAADPVGPWRFITSGTYRGQDLGGGRQGNDPAGRHSRSEEQGFLDLNMLNFEKIKLMAAELVGESFDAYDFTFEQLFLRDVSSQNAGIEFSYHREEYDNLLDDGQWDGISASVWVDVNPYLADGTTNPNLGRPFVFNQNPQLQHDQFSEETRRLSAFYEIDFTQGDSKNWLGKHMFNVAISKQSSRDFHDEAPYALAPGDRSAEDAGAWVRNVGNIGSFNAHPTTISYVGDSVLGASSYDQIKIKQHANPFRYTRGEIYKYNIFDRETQQWKALSGEVTARARKANVALNDVKSKAAIAHSKWLGGHFITTFGWREDEVDLHSYITERDDFNLVKVGTTDTLTPVGTIKDSIFSYGSVFHFPRKWLKRLKLPEHADLSVHYNESGNFSPRAGRTDAAGSPLPSPGGETKEYGLSVSLMDRKINAKLNFYKTNLANASASTPIGNNEIIGEGLIFIRAGNYLAEARRQMEEFNNPVLSSELKAIAEQFLAIAPPSLKDAYGYTRSGDYLINFSDPANSDQTADVVGEGMELELYARPIKGLNVGFNVAQQRVVQANIAPAFRKLFDQLTPKWQPLFHLPVSASEYAEGNFTGPTIKDRWDDVASRLEQTRRSEGLTNPEVREWRWNLFANYSFQTQSRLAGWGLGGALRWQDSSVIGYHSDDFINSLGEVLQTADLNNPIRGSALLQGDVWFSYRTKLFDRIDWKLQLNVRNALRDKKVVPIRGQPDSPYTEIAQVRVTQPTTYILSSTFEF